MLIGLYFGMSVSLSSSICFMLLFNFFPCYLMMLVIYFLGCWSHGSSCATTLLHQGLEFLFLSIGFLWCMNIVDVYLSFYYGFWTYLVLFFLSSEQMDNFYTGKLLCHFFCESDGFFTLICLIWFVIDSESFPTISFSWKLWAQWLFLIINGSAYSHGMSW